jgi:NADPH:quinone reductase-like Zn-dependent oxidoreductase
LFAYTYSQYSPADVLKKVQRQRSTPKQGEVLVRVYATTVSSADWRLRSLTMPVGLGWGGRLGVSITGPRKPVLRTDFSGVVVAVGAGVKRFKPGDAVIGFPGADFGAHAK